MSKTASFFKTEDFLAILLGAFLLIAALGIYLAIRPADLKEKIAVQEAVLEAEASKPFQTVAWFEADAALNKMKLTSEPVGKQLRALTNKPNNWNTDIVEAVYKPAGKEEPAPEVDPVKVAKGEAIAAETMAAEAGFADATLNSEAKAAIAKWQDLNTSAEKKKDKLKAGTFSPVHTFVLFLLLTILFGLGAKILGVPFPKFAKGFLFVFLLAAISMILAGQKDLADMGIEYAVWAIFLGMLISNTVGTPGWVKNSLKTEFFIKTGLVVMGAEVLFNKILDIGLPGMFVAWVVTPIVLITTYWFGQRILKMTSKSLNITICADMSVCGVSAAVATAAASKATKDELTVAIGLSMFFTAIMMVVMPLFIKFVGMPEVLGGAWIGGTIDASGAVVAAGAALSDKAMYVAATIKMIQNVLIGVIAFGVAVYFTSKVERANGGPKVGIGEIWTRFPKFILGFLGASILFSIIYDVVGDRMAYTVIENGVLNGFAKNLRTWLFCLAFASIGLSTNFRELKQYFKGGKPLTLYVCGQALQLCLTLLMAYLMFYKVFPEVAARI